MSDHSWHVYIIQCRDGTYYTGITNDLAQRINAHNRGKGCRYTKYRWPVKIVYFEEHPDHSSALKREAQIQGWSREKKRLLIKGEMSRKAILES